MQRRPLLGLALGGGFLRGAAHIGVLKVLQRENIRPDIIAGTSAGSIVAAMYYRGWTPEQMEKALCCLKPRDVYDRGPAVCTLLAMILKIAADYLHLPLPLKAPLGLMKGEVLYRQLCQWLEEYSGSQPSVPAARPAILAVTAVDINDGARVVFLHGGSRFVFPEPDIVTLEGEKIALAVRASCAVPGLFEPVRIAGRLLVDGGIRENIPVEVLRHLGAGVIIAVDVGVNEKPQQPIDNLVELLTQSLEIMGGETMRLKLEQHADVVIRPQLPDVGPWDFQRIRLCIERGERAAEAVLPRLKAIGAG